MPDLRFWLAFVAAFTIVVGVLMVGAAIHEYWIWKRGKMTAEDRMSAALLKVVVGVVVLAVIVVALASWAFAQEPHKHRPQDLEIHHKFYNSWMMPSNRAVSCCHDQDCQPAEARRLPNGQWEAKQEGDPGNFTPVPPEKVEYDRDSPDGRNHLCGRRLGIGNDFYVYCFIAGAGG